MLGDISVHFGLSEDGILLNKRHEADILSVTDVGKVMDISPLEVIVSDILKNKE